MKICVTAQGNNIDSMVDSHFGRCQYFLILDTENNEHEFFKNPNIDGSGGVGIKSSQLMAEHGVKAVLTGNVGPNAFETLKAAEIDIVVNVSGQVKEAIEKFKTGYYKPTDAPSAEKNSGKV